MGNEDLEQVLAEIRALGGGVPKRPPGCVSTGEWAQAEGLNRETAKRRLNALVEEGKLEKVGEVHDTVVGRRMCVWRVVKP